MSTKKGNSLYHKTSSLEQTQDNANLMADLNEKERTGKLDPGIKPLLDHINQHQGYYTMASCTGHVGRGEPTARVVIGVHDERTLISLADKLNNGYLHDRLKQIGIANIRIYLSYNLYTEGFRHFSLTTKVINNMPVQEERVEALWKAFDWIHLELSDVQDQTKSNSTRYCPNCKGLLEAVVYPHDSVLNQNQWESIRAGDFYCPVCPDNQRSRSGQCYWWYRETISRLHVDAIATNHTDQDKP